MAEESETVNVEGEEVNEEIVDEICGNDGSISVCVDWEGDITFSYTSTQLSETVVVLNDDGDACYTFDNLINSDDNSLYNPKDKKEVQKAVDKIVGEKFQ